jgi:Tfp pilus assembly protein PilV
VVRFFSFFKVNQSGLVLIETLIAFGVLSLVILGLLSGLMTSSKATITAREQAIAESLARSQLEYIKSLPYSSSYTIDPSIALASGWDIPTPLIELVHGSDDGIQKISVTPEHNGKSILSISTYKVNR